MAHPLISFNAHKGDYTTCGKWRSTPPALLAAAVPQWRYVKPWAMETPSQFRLPPPPDYQKSTIFQNAYKEVMRVGRKVSAFRTEEETMIGKFWYVRAS